MDIILVIFLAWRMGKLAELKGLSIVRWRWYTVFAWLGGYTIGINIGMKMYNIDFQDIAGNIDTLISSKSFIMVCLIGWGFAFASYFTLRDILQRKSDIKSKPSDINQHTED